MTANTFLIVNADDFGLSPATNAGIIAAHEEGIVTSASLMVRPLAASAAAAYARQRPQLGVGLHVDLGEWSFADGQWTARYEVVPLCDERAVREEVLGQWDRFRELLGREPSHVDSHQHVHLDSPVREVLQQLGQARGVVVRHFAKQVRYCGDFYGQTAEGEPLPQTITSRRLLEIIDAIPPGTTELACHPGFDDELETTYRTERRAEVQALCDAGVRDRIVQRRILLSNFAELGELAKCNSTAAGSPARSIDTALEVGNP